MVEDDAAPLPAFTRKTAFSKMPTPHEVVRRASEISFGRFDRNRAVTPLSAEPGIVGGVVRHVDDDQRQRRAVVINAIGGQVGSRTCASPMPPIRYASTFLSNFDHVLDK